MTAAADIRGRVEAVEEAYEYMLAYAAQGRATEGAGPDGSHIRAFLEQFQEAAVFLSAHAGEAVAAEGAAGFLGAFARDSEVVLSVLRILLARDDIPSEAVDNANGLIAVRSYLTSLFFLDKAALA